MNSKRPTEPQPKEREISEADLARLKRLCPDGIVPFDYAGMSEEDAIWLAMLLDNVDELTARNRVAFARGDPTARDLVAL